MSQSHYIPSHRAASDRAILVSPGEAKSLAEASHGGKALSVQLIRPEKGPPFYRVKLIKNGNVRTVRVEAGR